MQDQSNENFKIKKKVPLMIMTSDDTHIATVALLERGSYFGLSPSQIHVVKQEKVASVFDNQARMATTPDGPTASTEELA